MSTQQPEWDFIANLGDNHPIQYGGYFIFRDKTGVYTEEAEYLVIINEDTPQAYHAIYRFILDRLSLHNGHLIPFGFHERTNLPHPIEKYTEWFDDDIEKIASFIGITPDELRAQFTSADPLQRAHAYRAIGEYHGYDNLDSYPLKIETVEEAVKRYQHLDRQHNVSIRETL